jgi:hypothetical protein
VEKCHCFDVNHRAENRGKSETARRLIARGSARAAHTADARAPARQAKRSLVY